MDNNCNTNFAEHNILLCEKDNDLASSLYGLVNSLYLCCKKGLQINGLCRSQTIK